MARKLIIKPQMVTWEAAKLAAWKAGGRLLTIAEVEKWSRGEPIDIDIWLNDDNHYEDSYAGYFNAAKQSCMCRPKNECCLLVIYIENVPTKKTNGQRSMVKKAPKKSKKTMGGEAPAGYNYLQL